MPLENLSQLDRGAALVALAEPDSHALTLVIAANLILDGELLDEDEDVQDEGSLRLLLEAQDVEITEENLVKVTGFLMALVSESFTTRPSDTIRLSSAITEGDPFLFEENPEDTEVMDILWALHQVDLLYEDDLVEELSESVLKMMHQLADGFAFDLEDYVASSDDEDTPDSPLLFMLDLRRRELADQLRALKVPAEWIDTDQRLVEMLALEPA